MDLGGAAPDGHEAVAAVVGFEAVHVFDEGLGLVVFARNFFDVGAVQPANPVAGEDGLHGADGGQLLADGVEVFVVEDLGALGDLVGALAVEVPAAEHELVEVGERDEVANEGGAAFAAFAEADGAHLGEAAHGEAKTATNIEDARDKGVRDSAQPGQEDTELASGGLDLGGGVIFLGGSHSVSQRGNKGY